MISEILRENGEGGREDDIKSKREIQTLHNNPNAFIKCISKLELIAVFIYLMSS